MSDEDRRYTAERLRRMAVDLRETGQTAHGLDASRRLALADAAHVLELAAEDRLQVDA